MTVRALIVAVLMMFVSIGAGRVSPVDVEAGAGLTPPPLDNMLPDQFGDWRRLALARPVLPLEGAPQLGEAVAYRAYRDRFGRVVTLVVAYAPPLGDTVRLHRPETCYRAQGFSIVSKETHQMTRGQNPISIVQMQTESPARNEAVTYWLRFGDHYSTGHRLSMTFGGGPDSALVRVSSTGSGAAEFDLHEDFLQAFHAALGADARSLLTAEAS